METTVRSAAWIFATAQLIACGGAPFELTGVSTQVFNPIDAGSEASTSRDAQAPDAADSNAIDAVSSAEASTPEASGPPTRYLRDGAACYEVQNELAKCGSDLLTIPTDYCALGSVVVDGVPSQCQCTGTYNCACVTAAYAAVGQPFACGCNQAPNSGAISFDCK